MSPVFACVSRYTCLECVSHQNRIALFSSHFEVPLQRSVPSSSSQIHGYSGEKREKTRCDWFNDSVEKGVGGGWGESSSAPEAQITVGVSCVHWAVSDLNQLLLMSATGWYLRRQQRDPGTNTTDSEDLLMPPKGGRRGANNTGHQLSIEWKCC